MILCCQSGGYAPFANTQWDMSILGSTSPSLSLPFIIPPPVVRLMHEDVMEWLQRISANKQKCKGISRKEKEAAWRALEQRDTIQCQAKTHIQNLSFNFTFSTILGCFWCMLLFTEGQIIVGECTQIIIYSVHIQQAAKQLFFLCMVHAKFTVWCMAWLIISYFYMYDIQGLYTIMSLWVWKHIIMSMD